jgi:hypothetical protein
MMGKQREESEKRGIFPLIFDCFLSGNGVVIIRTGANKLTSSINLLAMLIVFQGAWIGGLTDY